MSDGSCVTKSELFRQACEINLFRRQSGLPLRDVQQMIIAGQERAACEAYAHSVEQHRAVYDQMFVTARAEYLRAKGRDAYLSAGGQLLLHHRARTVFHEFLSSHGVELPYLTGIRYGSH
jgi:hypothetical protein